VIVMVTLTHVQLSDDVYHKLAERADQNHRPVEEELAALVSREFSGRVNPMTKEEKLAMADRVRAQTPGTALSVEFVTAARNEGRA